jgi:hypothetical protein
MTLFLHISTNHLVEYTSARQSILVENLAKVCVL